MNILSLISIGVAAALIAEPFVKNKMAKKRGNDYKNTDKVREEYEKRVEHNRTHLPSTKLPLIEPDLAAVEDFIRETRFSFWEDGGRFAYNGGEFNRERRYIEKSEFDGDTLRFIELLKSDVGWFYTHCLGTVSEEAGFLSDFLRKKYPTISEKGRERIVDTYCINER